jgi:hypothetical protein
MVLVAGANMAANVNAADLAGHYYLENVREVGSELLLKPGGAFEFMLAYGAADYWAKGAWREENGSVILTSSSGKRPPPFRLLRSENAAKAEGISIRVVGPTGAVAPDIEVVLVAAKARLEGRTDSAGVASFQKTAGLRGVEFVIPEFEFHAGPYDLNPAHNDFTFEINGMAITEVQFKDERLTIEKGTEPGAKAALVMHRWQGSDHEMRYKQGEAR